MLKDGRRGGQGPSPLIRLGCRPSATLQLVRFSTYVPLVFRKLKDRLNVEISY